MSRIHSSGFHKKIKVSTRKKSPYSGRQQRADKQIQEELGKRQGQEYDMNKQKPGAITWRRLKHLSKGMNTNWSRGNTETKYKWTQVTRIRDMADNHRDRKHGNRKWGSETRGKVSCTKNRTGDIPPNDITEKNTI